MDSDPLICWPLSADGFIRNLCEDTELQTEYRPVCEAAVDILTGLPGALAEAIYVRGSVAIGRALPRLSDIDLIVIGGADIASQAPQVARRLLSEADFLQDVDIGVIACADIGVTDFGRKVQSYLAIESRRLWGAAIATEMPRHRPDALLAANRFPELRQECEWLRRMLRGELPLAAYRGVVRPAHFWARWSLRNVLRASHLLSMLSSRIYTNHLGSCCSLAARAMPEHARRFRMCLEVEREERSRTDEALQLLEWFMDTLIPEWEARVVRRR